MGAKLQILKESKCPFMSYDNGSSLTKNKFKKLRLKYILPPFKWIVGAKLFKTFQRIEDVYLF